MVLTRIEESTPASYDRSVKKKLNIIKWNSNSALKALQLQSWIILVSSFWQSLRRLCRFRRRFLQDEGCPANCNERINAPRPCANCHLIFRLRKNTTKNRSCFDFLGKPSLCTAAPCKKSYSSTRQINAIFIRILDNIISQRTHEIQLISQVHLLGTRG